MLQFISHNLFWRQLAIPAQWPSLPKFGKNIKKPKTSFFDLYIALEIPYLYKAVCIKWST